MKKTDLARYESYHVLLKVMDEHPDEIGRLPLVGGCRQELCAALDEIAALQIEQTHTHSEDVSRYREARKQLIDALCHLVVVLRFRYNKELHADLNYTRREFTRMQKMQLINVATVMVLQTRHLMEQKQPLPYVDSAVERVEEMLTVVKQTRNAFRSRQLQMKDTSRRLDVAMHKAREANTRLFVMLDLLTFSHPQLLALLKSAARPVLKMRRVSLMGETVEVATYYPIANVKVFVRKLNEQVTPDLMVQPPDVKRKSTAKGGFYVHHLAEGHYLLTASKPGYITTHQTVAVAASETTRVELLMERMK